MVFESPLLRMLFALCLVCPVVAPAAPAASAFPKVLVMLPAQKAAPSDLSAEIESWRADGLTTRSVRLNAAVQEEPGFSVLLLLELSSEQALTRWEKARRLPQDARIRRIDAVVQSGDIGNVAKDALFEVNVYRINTTDAHYRQFCAEYIAPLMDGQIEKRLMTAYTMYVEQGEEGERHAVLVKAYRDAPTYDKQVPDAKLAVRAQLEADHPTYSKWHSIKDAFRANVSETLARAAAR